MEVVNAIGRRKAAIARVYVSEGKGNITVNNRNLDEYFGSDILKYIVNQPFELLQVSGNYDVKANLTGGGVKGQAEALRLALARVMVKIDSENKPSLRANGFLTRDPREVERKKPGQPKARKRFQFSKR